MIRIRFFGPGEFIQNYFRAAQYTRNYVRHPGRLQRFLLKTEMGSEVAGHDESSQQTQSKTPNPIVRTGRLATTEPPSRSSVQEIDKRFLLGCESTNVSAEHSDKDANENVDADRVRTGRLEVNNLSIYSHSARK